MPHKIILSCAPFPILQKYRPTGMRDGGEGSDRRGGGGRKAYSPQRRTTDSSFSGRPGAERARTLDRVARGRCQGNVKCRRLRTGKMKSHLAWRLRDTCPPLVSPRPVGHPGAWRAGGHGKGRGVDPEGEAEAQLAGPVSEQVGEGSCQAPSGSPEHRPGHTRHTG